MGEKYPLLTPKEIISALAKRGFELKSQRGSHAKYSDGQRTVIIPMHREVARGTLYPYQLKFPERASVYPTGKRTPTTLCGGFFKRLRYKKYPCAGGDRVERLPRFAVEPLLLRVAVMPAP